RTLQVRHNNVIGFFVEISSNNAAKLQSDARFIHRQTLAGSMRFGAVELGELESRIATAADKALGLELALFDQLVAGVVAEAERIAAIAGAIAGLAVFSALAEVAAARGYVRPD